MANNIIDYSVFNANRGLDSLPFSKVDGLIFAQLIYINFDGIVPCIADGSEGVHLSDIAETENYEELFPLKRTAERNKRLLNATAYSKRFGSMKVNYFENVFDYANDTQFAAVTFILPNGDVCISFRGTDATITGWKENFNMLYMSPVAAQKLSVKYVEKVAEKTTGDIILLGHSKGGNLAIYAATMCNKAVKKRIKEIQSFDSPGFSQEFINSEKYIKTEPKISKYIPEESMVGALLNNNNNYHIIKSDGTGIFQHDPFMWKIRNNDFIPGEKITNAAQFFDETFNGWVYSTDQHQRELFIQTMFDIIEATNNQNARCFSEWSENLKGNTTLVIDTIKDLDPETRSMMLKCFGNVFSAINRNVKSTPKKLWADTKRKIKVKNIL